LNGIGEEAMEGFESLQAVFEDLPHAHLVVNGEGSVRACNRAFRLLHGLSDEACAVAGPVTALLDALRATGRLADAEGAGSALAHLAEFRAAGERHVEQKLCDGRTLAYHFNGRAQGGYIATVTVLPAERQEHDGVLQGRAVSGVGFFSWDLASNLIQLTSEVAKLYGHDPAAGLTVGLAEIIAAVHPEERQQLQLAIDAALVSGTFTAGDFRARGMDGAYRWLASDGVVIMDGDGRASRVVGIVQDITRRKAVEARLSVQSEELRAILDALPEAYLKFDHADRLVDYNRQAAEWLGLDSSRIGDPASAFLSRNAQRLRAPLVQQLKASGAHQETLERLTIQGQSEWADVRYFPLGRQHYFSLTRVVAERVQDRMALRESQEQLAAVMNNIPGVLYRHVVHPDGTQEFPIVSERIGEIFGLAASAQRHDPNYLESVVVPEDGLAYQAALLESRRTMQPFDVTVRLRSETKDVRWARLLGDPRAMANGDIVWDSLAVDVTQQREAEDALRASRQLMRAVLDTVPHWIWVKDRNQKFVIVNRSLADDYGKTPAEMEDHDAAIILTGAVAQKVNTEDRDIIEQGIRVIDPEWEVPLPDGRSTIRSRTKIPLRGTDGAIMGLVGISEDISQRVEGERALEMSRQLLRTVLDTVPQWIWLKDEALRYQMVNRSLAESVGRSPAELEGRRREEFFPGPLHETVEQEERRVLTEGADIYLAERRIAMPDGSSLVRRNTRIPIRDRDGRIVGLVGVSEDVTEQVAREQELRAGRQLLRTVVDTVPHWIWVKDRERRYVVVNAALARSYQVSVEDMLGKRVNDFLQSPYGELVEAEEQRVIDTGEALQLRARKSELPGGGVVYRTSNKIPLRDEAGAVTGLLGVSEDVSELQEIALALEESTRRLAEAQRIGHVGSWVWDIPSGRLEWSDEICRILGLAPQAEPASGRRYFDFIHPQDREQVRAAVEETLASGQPYYVEYRIQRQDGTERRVVGQGEGIRNAAGDVVSMQGVVFDDTERRRAQEELEANRAMLQSVLDTIPHWIWMLDLEQRYVMVNTAQAEQISMTKDQIVGRRVHDIVDPAVLADVQAENQRLFSSGEPEFIPDRVIRLPSGVVRIFNTVKLPIHDADGRVTGLVGISEDVTVRREAEEALRVSEQRLAEAQRIGQMGSWHFNLLTEELTWSAETYRICGLDPLGERITPPAFQQVTHPDDWERCMAQRMRSACEGHRYEMDFRVVRPDGTERHVRELGEPVLDKAGQWVAQQGVLIDITERRAAELALRLSEQRLAEAQRIAHVGSWQSALPGGHLTWSDETYRIFGLDPAGPAIDQDRFFSLVHPEDLATLLAARDAAAERGEGYEVQHRIVLADGTERMVLEACEVLLDNSGRPTALQGTVIDITEQLAAELALRISQEHLAEAQRIAHVGSWRNDLATGTLTWTDEAYRIFGYEPHAVQVDARLHFQAVHPGDQARIKQAVRDAMFNDAPYDVDYRIMRPDGDERYVVARGEIVRDATGRPTVFHGVVHDVTEAKLAEIELKQSRDRLAEAQRIAHVGSWETDLVTGQRRWSDETYRIFGYETQRPPVTAAMFFDSIHPDDVARVREALQRAEEEHVPLEIEHRVIRQDGSEAHVFERAELLRDPDGRPRLYRGIVLDITARKKVDIMKNEFVSVVSHELRTPLTSIVGALGLLHAGMAGEVDQTARDMLAIAKKNSDRLSRLINQILDLEKIESGRMHFQRWPVDVDGLLNAALEAHSAYAQQFDVTLRRSDRLSGVRVLGDEDGLMQVLANLISNAIKFSPTGSTVTLSAIQCGRTVRFGVRDEGQGIPHDDQSRIFDRFEQLDASDTRSIQGTGLGLSISRAIVMAHDGEIGVKSTLGAGSLFYFEIPVSQGD